MIDRLESILIMFRRHKYVEMYEVNSVINPVFICKKCGDRLYLDEWQMKSLPRVMKYNCKGRH